MYMEWNVLLPPIIFEQDNKDNYFSNNNSNISVSPNNNERDSFSSKFELQRCKNN